MNHIHPTDFYPHKANYLLIDVRSDAERQQVAITDSLHVPLALLAAYELPAHDHVVFYCHAGVRSQTACALVEQRYPQKTFYSLIHGLLLWQQLGYPVLNGLK